MKFQNDDLIYQGKNETTNSVWESNSPLNLLPACATTLYINWQCVFYISVEAFHPIFFALFSIGCMFSLWLGHYSNFILFLKQSEETCSANHQTTNNVLVISW